MAEWWKRNLWKVVLFPTLTAVLIAGVGLLRGYLHRQVGFDADGHPLDIPPPASTGPLAEQPPQRTPIGTERLLTQIAEDLRRSAEGDRPSLRYLSLAHRHDDPTVAQVELDRERQGLIDLVAALAPPNRTAEIVAVDTTRCLFRLDLAQLDWSADEWRRVAKLYPYGVKDETATAPEIARAGRDLRGLTDEPLVWVRADWWVAALTRPPLSGPGGIGLWTKSPPQTVKVVAEAYRDRTLDMAAAARELGLPDQVGLRRLIEAEADLKDTFGLAPLLRDGGSIPRDAWESGANLTTPYQELASRLGRGRPLVIR